MSGHRSSTVFLSDRSNTNAGIASLGSRPLGELLFANGRPATWTLREYALIDSSSPLFVLVRRCGSPRLRSCWARPSMFLLEGDPLRVTQMFLSPMIARGRLSRPASAPLARNASPEDAPTAARRDTAPTLGARVLSS